WAKVTRPHLSTAIDVLFDMTSNSLFDAAEIEKERQVIIEEINMSLDIPQQRASMLIDSLLWPGQPLGLDIAGTRETVSSISRSGMMEYMADQYRTGRMVVCVAGNVEHDSVCDEIRTRSASLVQGDVSSTYKMDDRQTEARIGIDRRNGEQEHVCVAMHGVSRTDDRRFAVDVLNTVLGGGMSSRLFTEIRENRGLAYDIHSYAEHFVNAGALVVYAGVDTAMTEECVRAVVEELSKMREPVGDEELSRAKELMKGRLELRLEDTQNTSLWNGVQQLLNGDILTPEEVSRRIDAVTAEEIARVAQELISVERLSLAAVGPVKDGLSTDLLTMSE
ncbi:MAG: insulinase family protein, partial [Dehalococcoidia bacterium]|nr:insulinase family protein [Dehalococcoidia bacterium]